MENNGIRTYEDILNYGTNELVRLTNENIGHVYNLIKCQLGLARNLRRLSRKIENVDQNTMVLINQRRRFFCQLYIAFRNVRRNNKLAA